MILTNCADWTQNYVTAATETFFIGDIIAYCRYSEIFTHYNISSDQLITKPRST